MRCKICGDGLIDLTVGDETEPSWHHAQGRHNHFPIADEDADGDRFNAAATLFDASY